MPAHSKKPARPKPSYVPALTVEEARRRFLNGKSNLQLSFRDRHLARWWCRLPGCNYYSDSSTGNVNVHYRETHLKNRRGERLCTLCDFEPDVVGHLATGIHRGQSRARSLPCPFECKRAWFKDESEKQLHCDLWCPRRPSRLAGLDGRDWLSGPDCFVPTSQNLAEPPSSNFVPSPEFNFNAPPTFEPRRQPTSRAFQHHLPDAHYSHGHLPFAPESIDSSLNPNLLPSSAFGGNEWIGEASLSTLLPVHQHNRDRALPHRLPDPYFPFTNGDPATHVQPSHFSDFQHHPAPNAYTYPQETHQQPDYPFENGSSFSFNPFDPTFRPAQTFHPIHNPVHSPFEIPHTSQAVDLDGFNIPGFQQPEHPHRHFQQQFSINKAKRPLLTRRKAFNYGLLTDDGI